MSDRNWNLDTWTPWAQPCVPLYLTLTLNPSFTPLREYIGAPLFHSVLLFENETGTWIFRPAEAATLGQRMVDYLSVPLHRATFEDELVASSAALQDAVRQAIELLDTTDRSDLAVWVREFRELEAAYTRFYRLAAFIEPVQIYAQQQLAKPLQQAAKDIAAESGQPTAAELLAASYSIDEGSFGLVIDKALHDLAAELLDRTRRHPALAATVKGAEEAGPDGSAEATGELLAHLRSGHQDLLAQIEHHASVFSWSDNNYLRCHELTPLDVVRKLIGSSTLDEAVSELRASLAVARTNRERNRSLKRMVVKQLTTYQAALLSTHDLIGNHLLDLRKQTVMQVNGVFSRIVDRIAAQTNVPSTALLYLLPQELDKFVADPDGYRERLRERQESCLVYQADFSVLDEEATGEVDAFSPPDDPLIVEGAAAAAVFHSLAERLDILVGPRAKDDQITGTTAFYDSRSPRIVGKVQVVRDPLREVLRPEAILVARSTTPDFMPAIRRCIAIVTDWGGETSHAAITARELSKPCIIGTNFASSVLDDGEEVELDFERGTIRRVQS